MRLINRGSTPPLANDRRLAGPSNLQACDRSFIYGCKFGGASPHVQHRIFISASQRNYERVEHVERAWSYSGRCVVHTSGEVCFVVVVECLRREMPRWLSACMFLPILMCVGGYRTRGKLEIAISSTTQSTRGGRPNGDTMVSL